ncbi:hypothetical protein RJT34_30363 [Clitoria ternatea]|uniref:Uncharacterized protein n=1 Tax=Clitoria ternatea TaxID=43366 RepID=A0AAN9ET57_CLITE
MYPRDELLCTLYAYSHSIVKEIVYAYSQSIVKEIVYAYSHSIFKEIVYMHTTTPMLKRLCKLIHGGSYWCYCIQLR